MDVAFLCLYFLIMLVPSVFGIHRYYLVYLYNRHRQKRVPPLPFERLKEIPFVTVQLPIFNEKYVASRLIRTVAAFDYPKDRMEIQVLDDSNDETVTIVDREVRQFREKGYQIEHIRRENREGFKAGALTEGLKRASGELVAVFDADFLPTPDFLKQTVPYFTRNKKIGMVQTRWEHLNRDFSLLTRAQAILLDGHFVIEHTARHRSGCFFNFNGTAGIWRKECIEKAGGWSGETLTEDIDLSYRAQMGGWKFIYVDDLVAPAELPVDINALKTQQHRWAKGSVQVAKKLLPAILKGPYPWRVKMEAFFHLAANFNYLLIAAIAFLMPVSLVIRHQAGWYGLLLIDLPFFFSATWSVSVFYYHSQKEVYPTWPTRVKYIIFSLALGIGLSINNAKAVLEGLFNNVGEFTRTPKFAVVRKGDNWKDKQYRARINWVSLVELYLVLHFTAALVYAIHEELFFSIPFVGLFWWGFVYSTALSFFQWREAPKMVGDPAIA